MKKVSAASATSASAIDDIDDENTSVKDGGKPSFTFYKIQDSNVGPFSMVAGVSQKI
jgi:hypothetical protein